MIGLRPGSLRASAQPFIKSAALQGLSRRQTEALLRERFGRSPSHGSVASDLRFYKDLPRRAGVASSTRRDRRIGEDVHAQGRVKKGNYLYVVDVELTDRRTGALERDRVSLVYDKRPTRGAILDAARDLSMTYDKRKEYDAGRADIIELYADPGA